MVARVDSEARLTFSGVARMFALLRSRSNADCSIGPLDCTNGRPYMPSTTHSSNASNEARDDLILRA